MAGIHLVYAVRVDHSGHKGMGCMAGTAPSHWLPSLAASSSGLGRPISYSPRLHRLLPFGAHLNWNHHLVGPPSYHPGPLRLLHPRGLDDLLRHGDHLRRGGHDPRFVPELHVWHLIGRWHWPLRSHRAHRRNPHLFCSNSLANTFFAGVIIGHPILALDFHAVVQHAFCAGAGAVMAPILPWVVYAYHHRRHLRKPSLKPSHG